MSPDFSTTPITFHIGDVLRKWREAIPLTRQALGREAGVEQERITAIEATGHGDTAKIEALLAVMGKTQRELWAALSRALSVTDEWGIARQLSAENRQILMALAEKLAAAERPPARRRSSSPPAIDPPPAGADSQRTSGKTTRPRKTTKA